MNNVRLLVTLCVLCAATAIDARADINIFLGNLNTFAQSTPTDYNNRLSTQFGVPQPQVATLVRSVAVPSDAFMVLQLAQMLGLPHEHVLQTYNANRGKGWGVIAKDLGIKPGSPEFHALKRGDYALTGVPGGKSHGKGKGPDKDSYYGMEPEKHGKGNDFDVPGQGKGKGKGHNK